MREVREAADARGVAVTGDTKLVPPKLCAWCHEPFTPHRRRGRVEHWTIACTPHHAKLYSGQLAKQNGSQARAIAARKAKAEARILALVGTLTPVEAYRVGLKRGYQQGYAMMPVIR